MLGHWRVRPGVAQCEFQFGTRLIYVEHRESESPRVRLAAVQDLVQAAWDDLPAALWFSESHCETNMAEWMQLCQAQAQASSESALFVFSIHIELDNPHPSYTIGKNPNFDWHLVHGGEGEDFWLPISRLGFEQFECDH
ncbi:hypothetical protein AZH11_25185 [Pseudomonas simiae]|nr:hypothetical protein AZH11_25185 [Pseudomonas simiae]